MSRTLDHLFDRNVAWAHGKTANDPQYFRRMAERDALGSIDQQVFNPVVPVSAIQRQAEAAFAALDPGDMASPPCCMPDVGSQAHCANEGGKR